MRYHLFNEDSSLRKLKFKQNKDKYIRIGTLILSIVVIIIGILYFSFAKYESSREFSAYNATVGEFVSSDVTIKLYKNGTNEEIKRLRPGVHSYASSSCTNGATLTWDNTTNSPVITNITKPTSCSIFLNETIPVNNCTYNGELVQGAEYTDGTYTYRYKQEGTSSDWQNITEDGWGVKLSDTSSTGTVNSNICTSINSKPIVSMAYMFDNAKSVSGINVSSFDTSSVTNMQSMFSSAGRNSTIFEITGIEVFDTSQVTNMSGMFFGGANSVFGGFSQTTTWNIGDLSRWDTSNVTDMSYMFDQAGYKATTFDIGNLSNWNTSNVTSMFAMFRGTGYNATTWSIGDLSAWDTSKVTIMADMFSRAGYNATTWSIGDLSSWDTSNVTNMSQMFYQTGNNAINWNSIGTLKVYATNIFNLFSTCKNAKATLNIYSNPASGSSGYDRAFTDAATTSGSGITVNYSSATTNIDAIIATKSSTSNVVKGVQLD